MKVTQIKTSVFVKNLIAQHGGLCFEAQYINNKPRYWKKRCPENKIFKYFEKLYNTFHTQCYFINPITDKRTYVTLHRSSKGILRFKNLNGDTVLLLDKYSYNRVNHLLVTKDGSVIFREAYDKMCVPIVMQFNKVCLFRPDLNIILNETQ